MSLGSFRRGNKVPGSRIAGGGVWKPVIRKGKKKLVPKCPPGKYYDRKKGRCAIKTSLLKLKLKRAARKRKTKLRRGLAQKLLKRKRSLQRRKLFVPPKFRK